MNIGFGPRVGYWAGWIVPPANPARSYWRAILGQAEEANRQLLRVGFDDVVGYVGGGLRVLAAKRVAALDAWRSSARANCAIACSGASG